jgi:uncharacterized protein
VLNRAKVEGLERQLGGRGEAEVIALALERSSSLVLVDERAARELCQKLNLPTRGTLGILLEAIAKGYLGTVRPIVDALRSQGFWLDAVTRRRVLALAGEND